MQNLRTQNLRRRALQLALALLLAIGTRPALADPHQDAIDRAIEKGTDYLLNAVQGQQIGQHKYGQVALETYALIVGGVSVNHPVIRANFTLLHKRMKGSLHTYSLACYIFALDAAITQMESDAMILNPRRALRRLDNPNVGGHLRPYLHAAVHGLIKTQNSKGAWRYFQNSDFDNSNTQFAVLGIGVGAKRKVPIDPAVWKNLTKHFVDGQQKNGPDCPDRVTLLPPEERGKQKDTVNLVKKKSGRAKSKKKKEKEKASRGRTVVREPADPTIGTESRAMKRRGWDYENKGGASWNMTCAGLSSQILARENLRGQTTADEWNKLEQSIWDGYGWVMGNWNPLKSYYGLYSLEKVADLGGVQKFGARDWYREVSTELIKRQDGAGFWKGTGEHGEDDRVATSFALLVLRRATTLLTRSPASRIIISGRSSGDPNDRSWVYIKKLDTCLHYPTLLKTLARRPNPKLAKFMHNIVDSYPLEWKGELVPEFVRVREQLPNRTMQKAFDGYLADITGKKLADPAAYTEWHKRWTRVHEIVKERKKEGVLELLKFYEDDMDSVVFKKTVIWGLIQLKIRKAIPLLIKDLDHESPTVRLTAYNSLRVYYIDSPPPFDPSAGTTKREQQAQAIVNWVKAQEKRRRAAR